MGIWTHASGHMYLTFNKYKERKQKRLNTILEKVLGKNWPEIGVERDWANGESLEEWRIRDRAQYEVYKAASEEARSGVRYMPEDDCSIKWTNEGYCFRDRHSEKVYHVKIGGSLETDWNGVEWFKKRLEELHEEGLYVVFARIETCCMHVEKYEINRLWDERLEEIINKQIQEED